MSNEAKILFNEVAHGSISYSPKLIKKLNAVIKSNVKRKLSVEEYSEIVANKEWMNGYTVFNGSQIMVAEQSNGSAVIWS